MSPYREPAPKTPFIVEATARGPLGEFQAWLVIEAEDPGNAIVTFVERMTEDGFDLLSEPRIRTFPTFSFRV